MFKRYSNQLLYFSIAIIFFLSFATAYGIYGKAWGINKTGTATKGVSDKLKPQINSNTIINKEIRYICGDKVTTKIPTTSSLVGLDFASLVKKFPAQQGWNIDDSRKNVLTLARVEKRVCPYHQDFRHLGISDGFLAVYEGPLGYNQKVLQRENISVSKLPLDVQANLKRAIDYNYQTQDNQGRLKLIFEFENEEQLNSTLENFDDFREQ